MIYSYNFFGRNLIARVIADPNSNSDWMSVHGMGITSKHRRPPPPPPPPDGSQSLAALTGAPEPLFARARRYFEMLRRPLKARPRPSHVLSMVSHTGDC